jgi:hypothetical protein
MGLRYLDIWGFRDLGIFLDIWIFGDLEIWETKNFSEKDEIKIYEVF